jgi:histidinol phosphatase-like PHP family hydrolase
MDNIFDAHLHTDMSDGRLPLDEVIRLARGKGYAFGISDHGGISAPHAYNKMNTLPALAKYVTLLRSKGVYVGLEVDAGVSDIPASIVSKFDYLILSMHHIVVDDQFKVLDEYFRYSFFGKVPENPVKHWCKAYKVKDMEQMLDDTLDASIKSMATGKYRIFGHPTVIPLLEEQSKEFRRDWAQRLLSACNQYGVAVEINNFARRPEKWFMEIALEAKALFSLGSDGHDTPAICDLSYPLLCIEAYKIPKDRILTTALLNKPKT